MFLTQGGPEIGMITKRRLISNGLLTGLVAYYKLDESSGNPADSTANAYNLTANNGATFAPGILNNGGSLDGVNDYFSTTSNLGMEGASQNYTVIIWIRPSSTIATQQTFWNHNQATNNTYEYVEWFSGNLRHIRVRQGVAADVCSVAQTFNGSTNYMICATYNGGNLTVSVNAGARTTFASTGNGTSGGVNGFSLGSILGGGSYFSGILDEIPVFNRAITPAEETLIYNGGTPLPYSSYS